MSYVHSGSVLFQKQRVLCAEHAQTKSAPKPLQNTLHGKRALGADLRACILERERERQVYLQPDGLDSNTYNTYNINIIKYLQYGRHTGTTNICLLPIVQSPWY